MRQRGRKSKNLTAFDFGVDGKPPRLEPPETLSEAEQKIFIDLVSACDPEHFRFYDLPLLCRYCEAVALAEEAAKQLRRGAVSKKGKASPWLVVQEKSVRAIVALSLRLRLSPQARLSPDKLARQQVQRRKAAPWE